MSKIKHRVFLRRAFSLIELIIVIAVIGTVYYLGFQGFKTITAPAPVSLETLPKYIREIPRFRQGGTLLCTDRCNTCYFRSDPSLPFEKLSVRFALRHPVRYEILPEGRLRKISTERYADKPICFSLSIHRGGTLSPTVVKNEKGYFLIGGFSPEALRFDSLSELKEALSKRRAVLENRGDFY